MRTSRRPWGVTTAGRGRSSSGPQYPERSRTENRGRCSAGLPVATTPRRFDMLGSESDDPRVPGQTRDLVVGQLPDACYRRVQRSIEDAHVGIAEAVAHRTPLESLPGL